MNEPACLNLRALYGRRFRVTLEESADSWANPWYYQIKGTRGIVYPHSAKLLAVEIDNHNRIAKELADMGLRCTQDGDQEKTFVFPLERFEEVAALVKLYRRPQLTEEQRKKLRERALRNLKPKEIEVPVP